MFGFKSVRGFLGIWNELRRLNRNLEWLMTQHPAFANVGLPPRKAEVQAAEKDLYEVERLQEADEEKTAAREALRILVGRNRGTLTSEEMESQDFDLFI